MGEYGEYWIHFIARIPGVCRRVACDKNSVRAAVVAAAFLANFTDVLFDTKRFVETVPDVMELIEGYSVRLGCRVELALPKEINLSEAVRINEEAARKGDALEG